MYVCYSLADLLNKIIACRQPPQNQAPVYEIVDVGDDVDTIEEPLRLAIVKESDSNQQEQPVSTPQEYLSPVISNVKPTRRHITTTRHAKSGKDLKEGENTYQALQLATVDDASEYQSLTHRVQPTEQDDVPPALPPKPGKKM